MIDRRLSGPVAQPFNVPTDRTLWFTGEVGNDIKYAMYVSKTSPELVLVVQKGDVVIREVASVQQTFNDWAQGIIQENGMAIP